MKVIAAYLLAVLGGNAAPSADDLRDILGSGTLLFFLFVIFLRFNFSDLFVQRREFKFYIWFDLALNIRCSVGADANDDNISNFLSEVKGKDIVELIASGREKLASVPSGGGAAVSVAAAPGGGAAAPAAAESKKEEKVEEKEESDDVSFFSI